MQIINFGVPNWLGFIFKQRISSRKAFSPVSHVIFDLDGTILDTESVYPEIYGKILEKYGKKYNDEVRLAVTGINKCDSCRFIVQAFQLPITVEDFYNEVEKKRLILQANPQLKPGAERLIRHLHCHKVPIAVATSSSDKSFQFKTANHSELFALFDHVVKGSSDPQVVNGKPAPDVFLVAARRFPSSPHPKECLALEDSPNGVASAKAAGMQVVMIPEDYCPLEKTTNATLVINSLEDFVPEDFGLPEYP